MERLNALSIDLEDWYHPELVRRSVQGSPVPQVAEATRPILDLLDRYQIKASFFVVGEVASQNPRLIRSIFERGHEIGCHGFSHRPLWELNEDLFSEELVRFRTVVEGILGKVRIRGFRAPTFSVDQRTQWALPILLDNGYEYDASVFPVKLNRLYGMGGAPVRPYSISLKEVNREDPESPLMEFPMSLLTIGRAKIPIAGGFYLRVLPLPFLRWGLKRINRQYPFLLYLHPWEAYPKTPRLSLPLYNRTISYYGMGAALRKLESLIRDFRFGRADRVLQMWKGKDEI